VGLRFLVSASEGTEFRGKRVFLGFSTLV
jgi:hypothetical protein